MIYAIASTIIPAYAWIMAATCRLSNARARLLAVPRVQLTARGRHTARHVEREQASKVVVQIGAPPEAVIA